MADQVREEVAPRRTDEQMLTWLQGHLGWTSPEFQATYGLAYVNRSPINKGYYYCDKHGEWMKACSKRDAVDKIRKNKVRRSAPRSLLQECSLQMRAHERDVPGAHVASDLMRRVASSSQPPLAFNG